MLRALLTDSEGNVTLVLGLGRRNFKNLHADEPIEVDLHNVDPAGGLDYVGKISTIVIFDDSTPEKHAAFMRLVENLPPG